MARLDMQWMRCILLHGVFVILCRPLRLNMVEPRWTKHSSLPSSKARGLQRCLQTSFQFILQDISNAFSCSFCLAPKTQHYRITSRSVPVPTSTLQPSADLCSPLQTPSLSFNFLCRSGSCGHHVVQGILSVPVDLVVLQPLVPVHVVPFIIQSNAYWHRDVFNFHGNSFKLNYLLAQRVEHIAICSSQQASVRKGQVFTDFLSSHLAMLQAWPLFLQPQLLMEWSWCLIRSPCCDGVQVRNQFIQFIHFILQSAQKFMVTPKLKQHETLPLGSLIPCTFVMCIMYILCICTIYENVLYIKMYINISKNI